MTAGIAVSGSMNEIPPPSNQYTAGPANGKRRRAKTGSTRIAIVRWRLEVDTDFDESRDRYAVVTVTD